MSKPGTIFGFLCQGDLEGKSVFRFGSTTKTKAPDEQAVLFLNALFAGLNRPRQVILFKEVANVTQSWDDLLMSLRNRGNLRQNATVTQEAWLGDRYFTSSYSADEFEKVLKEVVSYW